MKKYIFIFLLIPFLAACEKELDFKYHEVESQFVIEGNLSEEGSMVKLSYTVPMDEPFPGEYETDADVIITDLTDDVTYVLLPENGVFINGTPGLSNHEYELTVNHNGRNFKSRCLMRKGVEIIDLKFQWIKMPYDYVAILEVTSTISEIEGTCYWTRIYKNGEPYKWLMSHGSGAIDGKLTQTTFTTRQNPDDEDDEDNLKDGDLLTVMVFPISLEMYDYLVGISSDSNGPAMFTGDFCLGYFLAAGQSQSSIIFNSTQIPFYSE
ncbi:MAG: DUF4249 family protein [Muribaculaceae bacterium]|nr:DUF4249 family protein [Muribaculaceae bacterium]